MQNFAIHQHKIMGSAQKLTIYLERVVNCNIVRVGYLYSVGAECDQLVNICSFAVRCDRRWPSTQ